MTGNGSYFLFQEYNKNGSLIQLKILQYEDWNESIGFDTPNWLKWKIKENTIKLENENFKQLLIDREIVKGNQFIRQKGNLIVYESSFTINYIDLKSLYLELLNKEIEKEMIKLKNEDIKF